VLQDWLLQRDDVSWVSSVLTEVETLRALTRSAPRAVSRLSPLLDLVELVEISAAIRMLALTITPPAVRSLDAIHLATALHIGPRLTAFVTYDKRLADAARAAGLNVQMPS
jgi:predicted nucleic acid-binding protein